MRVDRYETESASCEVARRPAHPALQPYLSKLGFYESKYSAPLVVRIFDESISKEDVDASRWYLSSND